MEPLNLLAFSPSYKMSGIFQANGGKMTATKIAVRMTFLLGIFLYFCTVSVLAEDQPGEISSGVHSESVQERISTLRKLKTENPEAFQRAVQQKKQRIHQKVSEFRENNPEKFERVKKNVLRGRREHLQNLRQQDPQEFQRVMGGRVQKFREWKDQHPEKFQKFEKNHPRAAEGFRRRVEERIQRDKNEQRKFSAERGEQGPRQQFHQNRLQGGPDRREHNRREFHGGPDRRDRSQ